MSCSFHRCECFFRFWLAQGGGRAFERLYYPCVSFHVLKVYTTGTKVGKSVAKMYLELKAAGLDKEEAMELAKDYIRNIKNFEAKGYFK